ncbi:PREDICTED: abscission/NoCut checkpoint regulator-like isoform X1 [Acropora digitifera]|uniref:abscission/NoCut checkpoint regulator-like isoform X1 n=1 Tax=Acropora digitifera TaxID=70779 RepID=UPI00077A04A6|nr:PREDICTED: abscission/NoCut checkpoint regulator-like isoform X1 [Acropora digitifera]XP_015761160.1 PREDICTED: abscission/NoCut checkpoint regulator-like isoform X1 [Acropora digitifera]XP_015761161.1 PREDICTED: abscission/NoCut checkpoint regulator-like isoform X1 [Acropora digitifera]
MNSYLLRQCTQTCYLAGSNMAGLQCFGCGQGFGFFRREHGCKKCGHIFCSGCTSNLLVLPEHGSKKVKVCDQCYRNATRLAGKESHKFNPSASSMNDLNRNTAFSNRSGINNTQGWIPASRSVGAIIPTNPVGDKNCVTDPDETIRRRLEKLKSDDSAHSSNDPPVKLTDEELGNRFENLTGRKATSMQKSDVNAFLVAKKSAVEEVDDLMKQVMAENRLDEDVGGNNRSGITDREIEERLARLKDMDPSLTNRPKATELDSDEDDETASKRYLEQILSEVALDVKMGDIDVGETRKKDNSSKTTLSTSPTPGRSKVAMDNESSSSSNKYSYMFSKDYDASSDDEELPWCCICNGNAVLRCHGCDDDLYCRRCYREGHSREDYEDHDISEYRPPRKRR